MVQRRAHDGPGVDARVVGNGRSFGMLGNVDRFQGHGIERLATRLTSNVHVRRRRSVQLECFTICPNFGDRLEAEKVLGVAEGESLPAPRCDGNGKLVCGDILKKTRQWTQSDNGTILETADKIVQAFRRCSNHHSIPTTTSVSTYRKGRYIVGHVSCDGQCFHFVVNLCQDIRKLPEIRNHHLCMQHNRSSVSISINLESHIRRFTSYQQRRELKLT